MKGLLRRILQHKRADIGTGSVPTSVEAGQVYSFQTRPYTEFSPPTTGRFAAIKILGTNDDYIAYAVLDGIWSTPPTFAEVRKTSILNEHRIAHTGRPTVYGVPRAFWKPLSDLDDFKFVGAQRLSRSERAFFSADVGRPPVSHISTSYYANVAAEGEWRWSNDREDFAIEVGREKAKDEAARAAKEERYRARLKHLTWDQLLSETPFERWSVSPPYPSEEFTNAARELIHGACSALKKLGPKPRRGDVRVILKNAVIWFNEADERAGGVIETEEREDICAVLEEMAFVARQKVLVDEIGEWREW